MEPRSIAPTQPKCLLLLALAAPLVGAGACSPAPAGEPEAGEAAQTEVVVRAVRRLARPTYVSVSGEVEGRSTVNVGFKVAGVVANVPIDEGDAVAAGAVLAELETDAYQLGLQAASATADLARDALTRARQLSQERSIPAADLFKAETSVRQAEAGEGIARKQLADTRLTSPLAGVIARRGVQPGEGVAAGMPVFTIIAVDPVQVRVGVPEAEIGRIRPSQQATISIPALGGQSFEGRVRVVGIAADPLSRTYAVRVSVPNPNRLLRPGMIAEVRIHDGGEVNALTLPGEAIVRDPAGSPLVYVFDATEGRVHARTVTVGSVYGREVEITSGLEGNEQVVVGGQHRLRSGASVTARTVELSDSTSTGGF
jgi:membrane fusion protein (multidrug efflux system)